jgi:hypothetical protein
MSDSRLDVYSGGPFTPVALRGGRNAPLRP